VDCYVKWLRLKDSKEYREASQEILRLKQDLERVADRFEKAHAAYEPFLSCSVPADGEETRKAQHEYWQAESAYREARTTLDSKEQEACRRFGLFQWWDPDDSSITIKNAPAVVGPSSSVEVLDPPQGKRMGWHTQSDRDGWLTLKVNLKAPLDQSEEMIARLLRLHRGTLRHPNTRNRPDSNTKALEVWVCYQEHPNFSAVARQLHRKVSTVKGQYIRGCLLVRGTRPTGPMKQRRASIVTDPALEYQNHYSKCSQCQKAVTAGQMCPRFLAYVAQDTRAQRESSQDPSSFETLDLSNPM
jgi:hypothetical protein